MNLTDVQMARECRGFALDKKATDPLVLDLSRLTGPASYFLICSAESEPQLKAIANSILTGMKEKHGLRPAGHDGTTGSQWIILDYGSLLVHIMHIEKRRYYNLEHLWRDARVVK